MADLNIPGVGVPMANLNPQGLMNQRPIQNQGANQGAGVEGNPQFYNIQTGNIGSSFADFLGDAIQSVDSSMKTSEAKVQDYVSGKTDNMHDVMISMQQSQLSFQMMVEVRNKLIETYQELSRMSI